jgi:tetratricopeptide (TPR) repeat protein
MLRKILYTIFLSVLAIVSVGAQTPQNSDTIMVLPFENTSNKSEFNWVGESFASALADLLADKGLNIISNQERKTIQQSLKIPLTTIPSLATSVKIAQRGRATLLVTGNYEIPPTSEDAAAKVYVKAKIIRVNEGRVLSEDFSDGRRIEFIFEDALGKLQTIQGQLAREILYRIDKVLYKLDKSFPFAEKDFIDAANKVPARAFEAYIKGLLTPAIETRENYFKNALRLYAEDPNKSGEIYSAVALELGHSYLNQGKTQESIDYFGRVIGANAACKEKAKAGNTLRDCDDEANAEASFYISLIYWQQKNYEQAFLTLEPLADTLKLTSVYNTLGANAVQLARDAKKNKGSSSANLQKGVEYLKKASDSSPDDLNTRFNYGFALMLSENYPAAVNELLTLVNKNQRDGEAYFLLAKAFEKTGDAEKAKDAADKAIRFLTENNRYARLETDWQAGKTDGVNLRVEQPPRQDFVSVLLIRKQATPIRTPQSETENLLAQAQALYKSGNDDKAMEVLRKILVSEPMNAQTYLLLGMIYLRRGDSDQAISNLRTALFWKPELIDAHIALGKIYVQKGECQLAKTYAASALKIDDKNQEVSGLQRLTERCSTK